MTREEYALYLQSKTWRLKVCQVMARADWRCELCGRETDDLQVHHLSYLHVGDESLLELIALCRPCHASAHWRPYEPDALSQMALELVGVAFISRPMAKADLWPVRRRKIA